MTLEEFLQIATDLFGLQLKMGAYSWDKPTEPRTTLENK